ncbi:MAG TPA: hypothetical protein VFJ43_00965, partial [Bacteroidia bacterium]|nr:hypothetical protein [Bacteroidia bacterium]
LYNFKSSGKITQDGHLENFSVNVENRFLTELKSACKQLQFYDEKIDTTSSLDLVNLRKKPMFDYNDTLVKNFFKDDSDVYLTVKKRFDPINKKLAGNDSLKPSLYNYFSAVSWVDQAGMQTIKWSSTPESVERVNVSDREFFKRIQKGNTWAPLEPGLPEFTLESVFAKSTGENLAVVAIKSERDSLVNKISDWYIDYPPEYPSLFRNSGKRTIRFIQERFKPSVIMLSTKLYSVMNPVLPPNYGFCIMDPTGKVFFHSGGAKNLNENFLDDCDNSSDLKAAIYSRTSSTITSKYQNKSYRMNIKPIGKLPLFLVIFHDDEDNRTINTEVLSMTMILTLGYFCFITILLIVLRIAQWKRSKLRSARFVFEWLWPVKNKNHSYKQVFEFIIFLIPLLILFLLASDSFCSILLLFIS